MKICCLVGVLEERLDYISALYLAAVDITFTKGHDTNLGPTLTTAEHHLRDDLIMVRMYGLEILRHSIGGRPSNVVQIF